MELLTAAPSDGLVVWLRVRFTTATTDYAAALDTGSLALTIRAKLAEKIGASKLTTWAEGVGKTGPRWV